MVILLYFFTGFFLGTICTMMAAIALQPVLLSLGAAGRILAVSAPLLVGMTGGFRTAMHGYSTSDSLGRSIKKAYLFR
jgi:hypothetical protein